MSLEVGFPDDGSQPADAATVRRVMEMYKASRATIGAQILRIIDAEAEANDAALCRERRRPHSTTVLYLPDGVRSVPIRPVSSVASGGHYSLRATDAILRHGSAPRMRYITHFTTVLYPVVGA